MRGTAGVLTFTAPFIFSSDFGATILGAQENESMKCMYFKLCSYELLLKWYEVPVC